MSLVYLNGMENPADIRALRRDKYGDDPAADLSEDIARLAAGEPLAYVIGWVPFLNLRIRMDSQPLIPRPETEWWTEQLIEHLNVRFADATCHFLDLCAGSGPIGLAVLARVPKARVTFAELVPEHAELIRRNIEENGLGQSKPDVYEGDLFASLARGSRFDVIAANPPYIPEGRDLPESVTRFEPSNALFAGPDGLALIERIAQEVPQHLNPGGELWLECDTATIERAKELLEANGGETEIRMDQYGEPRFLVSYWQ
jgi:release factor glutamine methyltransferase